MLSSRFSAEISTFANSWWIMKGLRNEKEWAVLVLITPPVYWRRVCFPVIWKASAESWCCLSKLTCLMMVLAGADTCCDQCSSSTEVRSSKKRKYSHVSTPILADQVEKPLAEALKYSIRCASLLGSLYHFFSEFVEILSTTSYFLLHIWNMQCILSTKYFFSTTCYYTLKFYYLQTMHTVPV